MCGSMVDIQSATAEIRRGKKERRKKQDKNIMSASATQGGHNETQANWLNFRVHAVQSLRHSLA